MKSSKVLEMLQQNRIEELKAELQDEIFIESLKSKPSAKKRYTAMKRYLKTIISAREILTKPCEVEFDGEKYNSFTNSYSLALTKEGCGEIEMCDEPDRYPQVTRLINFEGSETQFDFENILAKAKSKGYKYTAKSIHSNQYLLHYSNAYFRIGLIDITYGIIADGDLVTVYHNGDKTGKIVIKNDIGVVVVLPVRIDAVEEDVVIIEA